MFSFGLKVGGMGLFRSVKTAEVLDASVNANLCGIATALKARRSLYPGCIALACASSVLAIGLVIHKAQIAKSVVKPIAIDVINAHSLLNIAIGDHPSKAVNFESLAVYFCDGVVNAWTGKQLPPGFGSFALIDGPTKAAGLGIVGKEFARTLRSDRVHSPIQGIPVGAGQDGDDSSFRSVELGQPDHFKGILQ